VYWTNWNGRLETVQRRPDIRVSLAAVKAYLKEEESPPGRLGSYWGEPTIPPGRTCTGKNTAPFHGALNYPG
jgi:hypothetical protein